MNVAIIGAGLAGLAVAWHLKEREAEVTLFGPLGGGASGVSTGLLHPFPGKMALPSWKAEEGMQAAIELLNVAEKSLGQPVANRAGVFRFALQSIQREKFCVRPEWKEQSPVPAAANLPGLWIAEGMTVYSRLYLQGLFQACLAKGIHFEETKVQSLNALSSFDRVVLAAGHETLRFVDLPLEPVKGQALLCRSKDPLPLSLIGNGHISPTEDPALCQIGSTYEHNFTDALPHKEVIPELLAKAAVFYPPAKEFEVVDVRAGIRLGKKGVSKPYIAQLDPRTWVFTGLGSRGLLYHALFGKRIASSLF
ncbi:MAG TPA: FAD-dependent oxidoreductase [Chlamydiales bacterium]|jgi:glycine/D-amino acid oxidase-like deaminating enzyme|nr:FAD-dependent oxidoreductase [Chlamydiales bacterium]